MRKLIAIVLVCAVASVASAQYEHLMWAKGCYNLSGGAYNDAALYQFDMNTGALVKWVDLPGAFYSDAFVDSGSKWYNAGTSGNLQVWKPAAQGATPQLLASLTVADIPGMSGGTIVDFELVNDTIYYMIQGRRNVPAAEAGTAWAATEHFFGTLTLDANGIPVAATQTTTPLWLQYFGADTLTGAMSYNPDKGEWVIRGFNTPALATSDPLTGPFTTWAGMNISTFNDYCNALYWVGDEGNELMLFGRMQNNYIRYSYNGVQGSFSGLASGGGYADFSAVLAIPEPATLALLAIGGLGIIARRRRNA